MKIQKEIKWMCENSKQLERFQGHWVMFDVNEGVVSNGKSLDRVLKAKRNNEPLDPFLFHVPSRDELKRPL